MEIKDIIIDEEFKNALRKLNDEEFNGLQEEIIKDGVVNDPLVVWEGENILVDGHHRYEIISNNTGLKYSIVSKHFEDRDAVLEWIYGHQGNRRNATKEEISYYRGQAYKYRKKTAETQARNNQYTKEVVAENQLPPKPKNTAEILADKYGVTHSTIKGDYNFSEGVKIVGKVSPDIKDEILSGKSDFNKKDVTNVYKQVKKATAESDKVIKDLEKQTESFKKEDSNSFLAEEERKKRETLEKQLQEEKKRRDELARKEAERIIEEKKREKERRKEEKKVQRDKEINKIREKIQNDIQNNRLNNDTEFNCVILDPPWPYTSTYDPDSSRCASPYPSQTIDEIYNTVKDNIKFNKDCIIHLWTTHQFLPDGLDLLKRWGFRYRGLYVWDKEKLGIGAVDSRKQTEFCLIGVQGSVKQNLTNQRDIIREPRREHSRKPDAYYEMVKSLIVGTIGEFYSREKRDGIITIGAEKDKF